MQMRCGLGVNQDAFTTRLHIAGRQFLGFEHHQVGFEGQRYVRTNRRHDVGPHREIRDEAAVHDVPMDAVGAGLLEFHALFAKAAEVGG